MKQKKKDNDAVADNKTHDFDETMELSFTQYQEIELYLNSINFNIQTQSIVKLSKQIKTWLRIGITGAIIVGKPRVGKTRSIQFISNELRQIYGAGLPIYIHNMTNRIAKTDKDFYRSMLMSINHPEFNKGTLMELKNRLVNALINAAFSTKSKKIILFIDEAYNLSNMDFMLLMDTYNELALHDILLTTFLVGTKELSARKAALLRTNQDQIVGRFMVHDYEFKGIMDIKDIIVSLMNFDEPIQINNKNYILTQLYFPDAYIEGKRMKECAVDLYSAIGTVLKKHHISNNQDIPMQYYMNMVKYVLFELGVTGEKVYFPDSTAWEQAVEFSGILQAGGGD